MILKGSRYKGKIERNTLYLISESAIVRFVEHQDETNEDDYVDVKFDLKDKQYALFANEFCPGFLANSKKADILLLVVDETHKKCASWICDVKVSVGGKEVIEHLIAQWIASFKHKNMLTNYLENYSEVETVAVITRNYQTERIQAIVEALQKEIESVSKSLNSMPISSNIIKQQAKLLTTKKEYQMFRDFKNGIVSIDGNSYPITIYELEGDEAPFCFTLEAGC